LHTAIAAVADFNVVSAKSVKSAVDSPQFDGSRMRVAT